MTGTPIRGEPNKKPELREHIRGHHSGIPIQIEQGYELKRLDAEIDRLKGQRDRLRSEVQIWWRGSYQDPTDAEIERGSEYLQPGDMTSD
jgi:hypothetical protein